MRECCAVSVLCRLISVDSGVGCYISIKQGKGKDLGFAACADFEAKISSGNAEQALSRDFTRLVDQMGFTRALSFFHSSNGFYWSNLFVIWYAAFNFPTSDLPRTHLTRPCVGPQAGFFTVRS